MNLHTKQEFEGLMFRLLQPLKPLYSAGGARLNLGDTGATYPTVAVEMEGFSRPLWGLVPFWAGGGKNEEFAQLYRQGLAAGTDPSHPEYWGECGDYDQRFVEMAAIACGILFAPDTLWTPLSEQSKKNLARWLYRINEKTIPECNWQFFMVLVNIALKKQGMPYSKEHLKQGLQRIDSYYLGEGWYQDGSSCQKDYYISFAMHYYGLVYAVAMQGEDPQRAQRFRQRAERFAQDFIYWFAADGSALHYGRSLCYRFGQAAFWSAYLFAGLTAVPVAVVKGILSRHFGWWMQQNILDRNGVLTIGYAYPNLTMAERYNSPTSPYWGMKSFLCLALPNDHPFWTVPAADLPPLDAIKPLPKADMLIQRRNGDVVAYSGGVCELHGHGHLIEKYAKFAYSNQFGFSCAHSQLVLHENCPDSMLAFVLDDTNYVFVRQKSEWCKIESGCVISRWSPLPGIQVTTTITPTEYGHERHHEIESAYACHAYDCGYAVKKFCDGYGQSSAEGQASAHNERQSCTVKGAGQGILIGPNPNTHLLYQNTEIPAICYAIKQGKTTLETQVHSFTE